MEVRKSKDLGRRTGSTFTESGNEILEMGNLDENSFKCIELLNLVAILQENDTRLFWIHT